MSEETTNLGWSALLKPAWLPAVAVLVGGVLLHSMNVLMLATVLPSVVREVGGAPLMSWTASAFLASSIVAATCTGYLSSIMGARTVFCAGALIFGVGALTCALAPSMGQIVAGRFVQGFGGGLLSAMAYVLVRNTFPDALWPRAIALLSGSWSLSILVGPMVGGLFARYGNWRGAFFAVAGIACLLALVARRALPRSASSGRAARVPGLRVALICAAIAAMSLSAIATHPAAKVALFGAALLALVLMLVADRRSARPLLATDAFSLGTQTGLALWLALFAAIAYSPLQIFVPIFLQGLHGLDPLGAGYMVAGASLGWTGVSVVVAGTPSERTGRLLVIGPVLMLLGLASIALLMPLEPAPLVFPAIVLTGGGIGCCWAFIAQRAMTGARKGEEDIAASSVATVQQTGFALGAALAGMVANAAGLSSGLGRAEIAGAAFWVPASFTLAALLAITAGLRLAQVSSPPLRGTREGEVAAQRPEGS
ncbi:MAG: MFS transporter [Alphaproteobacteria bacterium]|nr:MFS transporter [Alphaproteobacteria bacterium]